MPARAFPHRNLAQIIEGHPDAAPAIISAGETTSYGDLRQQVAAVRGGLTGLGIGPGDRVALVMATNWYFVVTYLATLGVGAVAVPLNPQSPTAELERELGAVRPKAVVVGPTGESAFSSVDRAACGIAIVLAPEGVGLAEVGSLDDLFVADPVPLIERSADDLAALLFTSGTAGSPKAAKLTHGNLLANLEQSSRTPTTIGPDDSVLGVLPLFHIYGLNGVLGQVLFAGASVVLVQRFDPLSALESIRERRLTAIVGVPPMYSAWLAMPTTEATRRDFESVRIAASGASKLDPSVAARFEDRYGLRIGEGYGLTEAAPVVTAAAVPPVIGTIGHPLPGLSVRLVDADGHDALVGDPGEIWVHGPNVFGGYLDDDAATARALTADGWLRTGDIAVANEAGELTIVDREKDLIIVSGFNVYPGEVEEVLALHPGVADVAVIGVPHPHSGEAVKAFVVAQSDRMLDEDQLIAFCSSELARYKCPTKITFVAEIPRGVSGKTLRRDLI